MSKKSAPWMLVLIVLALASLACATVMGGGATGNAQATANAAGTQAQATATAVQATAQAAFGGDDNGGDDNGGDDNGGDDSGNGGDDNGGQSGGGDYEFADRGPEDIPLFAAESDVTITIADPTNLIYDVEADVDEVADFYREAMVDLGWSLAPNGDIAAFGTVTLQYTRDGKTAIILIAAFTGATTVTATVS